MKRSIVIFFSAINFALIGCSGSLPHPMESHVLTIAKKFPSITLPHLEEGRVLYIQKCSGCHTLRLPSEFSEEKWMSIIQEMKAEAKLEESESQKVLQYIIAIKESETTLQK
ncbi:MAG: hypothetical protein AAB071_00255 [Bacteroidota bacterium]